MGIRERMMAQRYDRTMEAYERDAGPRRARLLAGLSGRVVELGPGTGVNLDYFDEGVDWVGVEPSEPMRAKLTEAVLARGMQPNFGDWEGARLALDDASADAVVCTLVLCSVPDQAATLAEVRRVLKPGGRFVFMEHVGAPRGTWKRRAQNLMTPFWCWFAGGCCMNRETHQALAEAGFDKLELEHYTMPKGSIPRILAGHVAGVAQR